MERFFLGHPQYTMEDGTGTDGRETRCHMNRGMHHMATKGPHDRIMGHLLSKTMDHLLSKTMDSLLSKTMDSLLSKTMGHLLSRTIDHLLSRTMVCHHSRITDHNLNKAMGNHLSQIMDHHRDQAMNHDLIRVTNGLHNRATHYHLSKVKAICQTYLLSNMVLVHHLLVKEIKCLLIHHLVMKEIKCLLIKGLSTKLNLGTIIPKGKKISIMRILRVVCHLIVGDCPKMVIMDLPEEEVLISSLMARGAFQLGEIIDQVR